MSERNPINQHPEIDFPANIKALNLAAHPVPKAVPLEATNARALLSHPSEREPEEASAIPTIVRAFQADQQPIPDGLSFGLALALGEPDALC
jgi:hypothetical protein